MSERKDGGPVFPTITIFRNKTDFFGKSIAQEITVNPDNLRPFERDGYYGPCMACDTDLHRGDWYEIVGRGRRYWCGNCVDFILGQPSTADAMLAARSDNGSAGT